MKETIIFELSPSSICYAYFRFWLSRRADYL